jgi:hypothetical protein
MEALVAMVVAVAAVELLVRQAQVKTEEIHQQVLLVEEVVAVVPMVVLLLQVQLV